MLLVLGWIGFCYWLAGGVGLLIGILILIMVNHE